jgi:hypothetical protein
MNPDTQGTTNDVQKESEAVDSRVFHVYRCTFPAQKFQNKWTYTSPSTIRLSGIYRDNFTVFTKTVSNDV